METSLPFDFPPLVELAVGAAMLHTAALAAYIDSEQPWNWKSLGIDGQQARTQTQVRLLSDLTQPGPQGVWLVWLAKKAGIGASGLDLRWVRAWTNGPRQVWVLYAQESIVLTCTFDDAETPEVSPHCSWGYGPSLPIGASSVVALRAAILLVGSP